MRYLEGHFAPVEVEVTAYDLPVTGRIPVELGGRYVRNDPNPVGVEEPGAHVWGMGQGMVHGVRLRDGRAEWYRNRFVRVPGFAPMVHVLGHAGRTFAMAEGGLPAGLAGRRTEYRMNIESEARAELDTGMTSRQWGAARLAVDRPLITQLTEPDTEVDLESLFAFGLERLLGGLTVVMTPRQARRSQG